MMVVIMVIMIGAPHIATKESKSSLSSLSPCMLLSNGRELVGKLGPVDDGDDDYEKKDTNIDDNLYIIGRFCLSVCLSRKMITLPNGHKSSSLGLAISFFKHCYKKMFSMSCRGQQFFF